MPEWKPKRSDRKILGDCHEQAMQVIRDATTEEEITEKVGIDYSQLRGAALAFSVDPDLAETTADASKEMAVALAFASGVMTGIYFERERGNS